MLARSCGRVLSVLDKNRNNLIQHGKWNRPKFAFAFLGVLTGSQMNSLLKKLPFSRTKLIFNLNLRCYSGILTSGLMPNSIGTAVVGTLDFGEMVFFVI